MEINSGNETIFWNVWDWPLMWYKTQGKKAQKNRASFSAIFGIRGYRRNDNFMEVNTFNEAIFWNSFETDPLWYKTQRKKAQKNRAFLTIILRIKDYKLLHHGSEYWWWGDIVECSWNG